MNNAIPLTLKEIADWQLTTRDKVSPSAYWAKMPSFQRGLVWSPAQIEVLWDSLMRGIPIGALSLLPIEGNERFRRGEVGTDLVGAYWVVDGQQRSNAIALGFRPFPLENVPILWLDLLPDRSKRARRKFFFYVTTPGRPWGYCVTGGNEEKNSEKVPTDEYRRVIHEELKWNKEMGSKPPTYKLWPVKANLPVPFSKLRELYDSEKTLDNVIEMVQAEDTEWAQHFRHCLKSLNDGSVISERIKDELRLIEDGLHRIRDAKTIGLIAYGGLSGDEDENQESDENSNIAVYFSRLNRGGTEPRREDLDYSILKSIVPELSIIDEYAKNFMHPSRLANIAMLTYLSLDKWKNGLNRSDIYKLQTDDVFRNFILPISDTERSRFKEAVDAVKALLEYGTENEFGLPTVMCSSIAKDKPRLFRFLILLVLQKKNMCKVDRMMLITFVTLASWFGKDDDLDYQLLFESVVKESQSGDISLVLAAWIGNQIETEKMVLPPREKDFEGILCALSKKDFDLVREVWNPIGYADGLDALWDWRSPAGRGFLLYVCRKYLARTFTGYDPASSVWNEDDRPWDYDHIIPQCWLQQGKGNRHGKYHDIVSTFLGSIGNIAPVPFSINRSKHDAPPADYLGDDNEMVLVDFCGLDGERPYFVDVRPKKRLEDDKALACSFAYMTTIRWIALYKEWLRLPVFKLLTMSIDGKRKASVRAVQQYFSSKGKSARIVYLWADGKQYDVEDDWDWTRPWIACGVKASFKRLTKQTIECFLCVCVQKNQSQKDRFEVGLRRSPESNSAFDEHNQWWIEEDDLFSETDSLDEALIILERLLGRSDVHLK